MIAGAVRRLRVLLRDQLEELAYRPVDDDRTVVAHYDRPEYRGDKITRPLAAHILQPRLSGNVRKPELPEGGYGQIGLFLIQVERIGYGRLPGLQPIEPVATREVLHVLVRGRCDDLLPVVRRHGCLPAGSLLLA